MNAPARIIPAILAADLAVDRSLRRAEAENRKLRDTLERALTLLALETDRREYAGEDVAHIRSFIREAVG